MTSHAACKLYNSFKNSVYQYKLCLSRLATLDVIHHHQHQRERDTKQQSRFEHIGEVSGNHDSCQSYCQIWCMAFRPLSLLIARLPVCHL